MPVLVDHCESVRSGACDESSGFWVLVRVRFLIVLMKSLRQCSLRCLKGKVTRYEEQLEIHVPDCAPPAVVCNVGLVVRSSVSILFCFPDRFPQSGEDSTLSTYSLTSLTIEKFRRRT